MKTTFFFAAALVASVSAMDIKEKLKQFRDPDNVNPEVRELVRLLCFAFGCRLVLQPASQCCSFD
jgi:hypothetical protein